HPSTPMHESDLAEHLRLQTSLPLSNIPFTQYPTPGGPGLRDRSRAADSAPDAAPYSGPSSEGPLAARIRDSGAAGIVLDALDESHLRVVGEALQGLPRPVFAIGSGGLSHAIAIADPQEADPIPSRGS